MDVFRGRHVVEFLNRRLDELSARLDLLSTKVDVALNASATLEAHLQECDRRYKQLSDESLNRHSENLNRFEKQDDVLDEVRKGQSAQQKWILGIAVMVAASAVGFLVEILLHGTKLL